MGQRARQAAADDDGRPGAPRRARRTLRIAGAVLAATVLLATPVAAQTDAERERDSIRDEQDRVAEELDVLRATDEEIDAVLDGIEADLAAQQDLLDAALAAADAAARAEADAEAELAAARDDVAVLEQAIVEMAVASYVHPPTADLVQSLQATTLSDALVQKIYLDARARRDLDLLGLLEEAEAVARERADALAAAAEEAEAAVARADAELVGLQAERDRQAAFAGELQGRIDAALAEAAVLADLDADLSARIAEEQAELIARLPPPTTLPPTTLPPTTVPAVTTTTAAPSEDGTPAPTTTTTRPTTTTTRPRPETETPPLRTVQGITVHADIADDVDAMLTAASADGIDLFGSGYRSTERQIELRRANCGPTEYDIWERPASTCSPPTAIPGRSLHEQGRAVDLTYEGRLITSRDNAGFRWLAENAADYGLFNLPSEPWHWSTTGS